VATTTAAGGVRVEGARELRRTLKRAGDDLSDLKDTHATVARIVAGAATPPRGPTGRLAASVRGSGTKTASVVRAGRKAVPYAGPIHWGWRRRNIEAQPFLTTAAASTEPRWVGLFAEALDTALAKVRGAA
jgi:hypothetical protein